MQICKVRIQLRVFKHVIYKKFTIIEKVNKFRYRIDKGNLLLLIKLFIIFI